MKLRDIVDDLRLIHVDCQMVVSEGEFLPIGRLSHRAADEILSLRKELQELKGNLNERAD